MADYDQDAQVGRVVEFLMRTGHTVSNRFDHASGSYIYWVDNSVDLTAEQLIDYARSHGFEGEGGLRT